ncbi:capsid size determination protein [Dickeya dadantii]|uniref:capsid size determination protein n=1 Tax=Dickeya dadantii TaxID=204038 RepID=UPI0013732914|nr:capsid size determination protein [Dickeya dadantii]NAT79108.1 capsid size determination protein [Dickeya dadantii]NPE64674.1 capsid size determination protein [Dickeya dadantii]
MSQTTPQSNNPVDIPDVLKKMTDTYLKKREAHLANASELDNITTAMMRANAQQAATKAENQLSDTEWRTRFLKARGEMTEELKAQQLQRLAQRELAHEYDGLLAQLEIDQLRQQATCHASAKACCHAHASALRDYAEWELSQALDRISTALIRAITLKRHMLGITTSEFTEGLSYQKPDKVVMEQVVNCLITKSNNYRFEMDNEPVLSVLGLDSPSLPHADFPPVANPIGRMNFFRDLKEKEAALTTRGHNTAN